MRDGGNMRNTACAVALSVGALLPGALLAAPTPLAARAVAVSSTEASSAYADSLFDAEASPAARPAPRPTLPAIKGPPSPLLLRSLRDAHEASGVGGTLAVSIYSQKHQRFEAAWNDSLFFVPASTLKL